WRDGHHARGVLGRNDDWTRPTALKAGATYSAAERRHLRGLPADRAGSSAGPVRPRYGARLNMQVRRKLIAPLLVIAIVATAWISLGIVVTNTYYQLILT